MNMKKMIFVIMMLTLTITSLFAQNKNLPRLAVVQFSVNTARQKAQEDAIAIRNLVQSNMVATGKQNTELILERLKQLGENDKAAQICVGLEYGGYKDWFLPSQIELLCIYGSLIDKGFEEFKYYNYWSSSQANLNEAWSLERSYGCTRSKNTSMKVRAILAF
jgi:hypothetical protein